MAHVHLVASSDDYLLEQRTRQIMEMVAADFDGVDPEILPDDTSPEHLGVELCSPSLFAPRRILVVENIRPWIDVPPPRKGMRPPPGTGEAEIDAAAVAQVLDEGLSDDIALVLRAHCVGKPKGVLVAAVEKAGHFHWQPVPPAPKPWEDAILSSEQVEVLRNVVASEAPSVRFEPAAERLLFERLGFAPRLLAQEAAKLAAAAAGAEVDVDLVRRLSFPREGSIEEAMEAVIDRRAAPVLRVLSAAAGGLPVRDLQGQLMSVDGVFFSLFAHASAVFQQLLYLRLLGEREGFLAEMSPNRTGEKYWYPQRFKKSIGPRLEKIILADGPSPLVKSSGKALSPFVMGNLFQAAGRYSEDDLQTALADLGRVGAAVRSDARLEALSTWFSGVLN